MLQGQNGHLQNSYDSKGSSEKFNLDKGMNQRWKKIKYSKQTIGKESMNTEGNRKKTLICSLKKNCNFRKSKSTTNNC